jgi:malate dehydrogenase (oxaloacetate-decarboxylating)(NADP+)
MHRAFFFRPATSFAPRRPCTPYFLRTASTTVDKALSGREARKDASDYEYTKRVAGPGRHVKYALRRALKVRKEGREIVTDPLFNKGTAFRHGERDRLGLRGLLPPRRLTMQSQVGRIEQALAREDTPMRKNIMLRELHDRNETLFHRVLVDNIKELAPVIYTPTVGEVCQTFGSQFRRPRGMYFCAKDRMNMGSMMFNWPAKRVDVVVVTDGSRILGLGDLGANGMGIPIGKLALYCAAGGIAPHRVLPVQLDFGTNNPDLLNDEFYLGLQHPRLEGEEYMELLDEFVHAVFNRYPNAFLQFEDFSSDKAADILERYRGERLVFNDDIQGTGAVAVAGIMSALRSAGLPPEALQEQRIVVAGAGSAGLGVAEAVAGAMEQQGLSAEEACSRFAVVDVHGVLTEDPQRRPADAPALTAGQKRFARDDSMAGLGLLEAVRAHEPTILLGLSACGGLFNEDVVRAAAASCERPIVFPLSNPTSKAECTAEEAHAWTDGRCIFASGSPFAPFTPPNQNEPVVPSQCNNMFIFPGLGLGATLSGARLCSDAMVYACSVACAESLTEAERAKGMVFPDLERIREVSLTVAVRVIEAAADEGLCTNLEAAHLAHDPGLLREWAAGKMYDPMYVPVTDVVYTNTDSATG